MQVEQDPTAGEQAPLVASHEEVGPGLGHRLVRWQQDLGPTVREIGQHLGQNLQARFVCRAEIDQVDVTLGDLLPVVPHGTEAQLEPLCRNAEPLHLRYRVGVDRDVAAELRSHRHQRCERRRTGMLDTEADRPCQQRRVVLAREGEVLVRDHDIRISLGVADRPFNAGGLPATAGHCLGDDGQQFGHERRTARRRHECKRRSAHAVRSDSVRMISANASA